MGVSTKHPVRVLGLGVVQRTPGHFARQAEPGRVEPLQPTNQLLLPEGQLLQLEIDQHEEVIERQTADDHAVELVSVNREMPEATKLPGIFLIDLDAHQVRHHLGKTVVMIALDPDYLHPAFGIRQLADVAQELPVLFFQAAEVQVAEDIAQKNEAAEGDFLQQLERGFRTAHLRPQVQVGKDHRVATRRLHASYWNPRVLQHDESSVTKVIARTIFGNQGINRTFIILKPGRNRFLLASGADMYLCSQDSPGWLSFFVCARLTQVTGSPDFPNLVLDSLLQWEYYEITRETAACRRHLYCHSREMSGEANEEMATSEDQGGRPGPQSRLKKENRSQHRVERVLSRILEKRRSSSKEALRHSPAEAGDSEYRWY